MADDWLNKCENDDKVRWGERKKCVDGREATCNFAADIQLGERLLKKDLQHSGSAPVLPKKECRASESHVEISNSLHGYIIHCGILRFLFLSPPNPLPPEEIK